MGMTLYEKTLQRAFRLLSYKARTIAEMRQRLLEKEWAESETVEQVISRLLELNYLNDDEYAINFARSRLALKPLGPIRLRRDLQRKKLSPGTVDATLAGAYSGSSEEELLESTIAKRVRLKGVPSDRAGRHKLMAYLLRRGFSYDLVVTRVHELGSADEE